MCYRYEAKCVLKHCPGTQEVGEPSQNYVGKTHYFGIPTKLVLVGGSFSIVPLLLGALLVTHEDYC